MSGDNLDDISTDDLTGSSLGDPQFALAIQRGGQSSSKAAAEQLLKECRTGQRGEDMIRGKPPPPPMTGVSYGQHQVYSAREERVQLNADGAIVRVQHGTPTLGPRSRTQAQLKLM